MNSSSTGESLEIKCEPDLGNYDNCDWNHSNIPEISVKCELDNKVNNIIKIDPNHVKAETENIDNEHFATDSAVENLKIEVDPIIHFEEYSHSNIKENKDETCPIDEMYPCEDCGKPFADRASMLYHKSYMHKIEVSDCQICGKEFKNKLKLQRHVNSVHNDRSMQCQICGKFFKNHSLLYGHKKIVHEVTENLACSTCGLKVMNTYKLQKHLKRCRGYKLIEAIATDAPPTCKECNKTFKTEKSLYNHEKFAHSSDLLKCQICQNNFKNIPSFRLHLKRAHKIIDPNHILALIKEVKPEFGKRKKKEGKSDASDLTAYQKQRRDLVQEWKEIEKEQNALKMTVKLNINNQCNECGKSFSHNGKLNNHIRMKHTFEPSTCPFCGNILENKSYLAQHIKQFHRGVSKAKETVKKMRKDMLHDLLEEFPMKVFKTENDRINTKKEMSESADIKQHLNKM